MATNEIDFLTLLSSDDLAALKNGYDRDVLLGGAPKMVKYKKAKELVTWVGASVFGSPKNADQTTLTAFEREIVIISVAMMKGDVFILAGHIYWTMMEDTSVGTNPVERVADVFMTVAAYSGVNEFRWSIELLTAVLIVLKKQVDAKATDSIAVLGALKGNFPTY